MEETTNKNQDVGFFWKREINYGQAAGFLIGIIVSFGTLLWEHDTKLTEQNIRIQTLEKAQAEIPNVLREIVKDNQENNKAFQAKLEKVLIDLQNKKDR